MRRLVRPASRHQPFGARGILSQAAQRATVSGWYRAVFISKEHVMAKSSIKACVKALRVVATAVLAIIAVPKVVAYLNRQDALSRLFDRLAESLDHAVGWDRLP